MGTIIDVLKRKSPDIWQWADTKISVLSCSETLIDEMIEMMREQFEDSGRELLDVHVYRLETRILPCVCMKFLTRPKQK